MPEKKMTDLEYKNLISNTFTEITNKLEKLSDNKENVDIVSVVQWYRNLTMLTKTSYISRLEILKEYKEFVDLCEKIKKGDITSEEGFKQISSIATEKKIPIFLYNIFKFFEILFWSLSAAAMIATCILVTPMTVAIHPILGLSLIIATVGASLFAFNIALNRFCEFESFGMVNNGYNKQKDCIEFFRDRKKPIELVEESNLKEEIIPTN